MICDRKYMLIIHKINISALIFATLLILPAFSTVTPEQADSGWVDLFNGKDKVGLYTFLEGQGLNKDLNGIFNVSEGEIKVKVGPRGYIGTLDSFSTYITRVEFKFLEKGNENSNAGLLYHIREYGEKRGGVWPVSMECQMQKRGAGEAWTIFGVRINTTTQNPDSLCKYDPLGVEINHGAVENSNIGRQCLGSSNPYIDGEWNRMEVKVYSSDSVVHQLNDVVTFRGWNLRKAADFMDMSDPLVGGRIAVQSEGAAISYRNFMVQKLDEKTHLPINARRGCTDKFAENYNSAAVLDNGSCLVSVGKQNPRITYPMINHNKQHIEITLAQGSPPPEVFDLQGNKKEIIGSGQSSVYRFIPPTRGIYILKVGSSISLLTSKI